jgi:hypothetical protein
MLPRRFRFEANVRVSAPLDILPLIGIFAGAFWGNLKMISDMYTLPSAAVQVDVLAVTCHSCVH